MAAKKTKTSAQSSEITPKTKAKARRLSVALAPSVTVEPLIAEPAQTEAVNPEITELIALVLVDSPTTEAPAAMVTRPRPNVDQVRARAYARYLAGSRDTVANWFAAEKELSAPLC